MHAIYNNRPTHNTYKNESKHSEMGPVRQNPIQRTVRSAHMCVRRTVHNIVAHNIAQNIPDNVPSYPPDNHHCADDVYVREAGGYRMFLV